MTRETVFMDTPARSATSLIVAVNRPPQNWHYRDRLEQSADWQMTPLSISAKENGVTYDTAVILL
jgi:hypothetical protein